MSARDTIAAIATAHGMGGVGIIRISGTESAAIASHLFRRAAHDGSSEFSVPCVVAELQPRQLYLGHIYAVNQREEAESLLGQQYSTTILEVLDEVLLVYMPAPHSFTGEDVVEIHAHGGSAVLNAVLTSVLHVGARHAEPGEFSRRAFLQGKIDLTQAEAIAELIAAPSQKGVRLAQAKLSGALGSRIAVLREQVDALRAMFVGAVDFPDDAMDGLDFSEALRLLALLRADVQRLLAAYSRARCWREGALVVLAGDVNVGKSSLLNALLGRERAIVTDIPGTTRDFLEESINLDGLPVRLTDTAGLRASVDAVEEAGVLASRDLIATADLVLLVVAACSPLPTEALALLEQNPTTGGKLLLVRNKIDLVPAGSALPLLEGLAATVPCVSVSAKCGLGLEILVQRMRAQILAGFTVGGEPQAGDIAPNLRQSQLLEQALDEFIALEADLQRGISPDLAGVRLETAALHLEDIIGFSSADAVLDRIFSSFCIGK